MQTLPVATLLARAERLRNLHTHLAAIAAIVRGWIQQVCRDHPDVPAVKLLWGDSHRHLVRLHHGRRELVLSRPLLLALRQHSRVHDLNDLHQAVLHHLAHCTQPCGHHATHGDAWHARARALGVRAPATCRGATLYY